MSVVGRKIISLKITKVVLIIVMPKLKMFLKRLYPSLVIGISMVIKFLDFYLEILKGKLVL